MRGAGTDGWTVADIAKRVNGRVVRGDGAARLTHVDVLHSAGPNALTFVRDAARARDWSRSRAGAVLVPATLVLSERSDSAPYAVIEVADPDLALIALLEAITPPPEPASPGAHPTSVVAPDATVAPSASIGPACIVGARASIGESAVLGPGTYVGAGASIGARCVLHPGVKVLDRCVVGDGCILHAGVVIGADGFGYRPAPNGRGVVKIPHAGNVIIESDVEIGANSCIDRAKFGSTTVGAGTKIDNLVQVGHGVNIGRGCLIAAQVGIAGSCVIGDGVQLGGQVGVGDNLAVGAGAKVAGKSGVLRNVDAGETVMGYPAEPIRTFFKFQTILRRLARADFSERPRGRSSADKP